MKAIAPVALTLLYAVDPDRTATPYALLAVAIAALIAFRLAVAAATKGGRSRARTD